MGNAYHRKIPLSRGTRTRGTGIKYTKPPASTPAGPPQPNTNRQWNIDCLMTVAGKVMDAMEDKLSATEGADEDAVERIFNEAFSVVHAAVHKNCDYGGVAVDNLLTALRKDNNTVLLAVGNKFERVFAELV